MNFYFIISRFSSVHYSLLAVTSSICLPILAIKGNQHKCHPKPNPNLQPKLVPPPPNQSNSLLVDLNTANSNGNTKINRNRSNSLLSSIDDCGDHDQNELLAADNNNRSHTINMTIGHNASQEHLGGCKGIFCGWSHSEEH